MHLAKTLLCFAALLFAAVAIAPAVSGADSLPAGLRHAAASPSPPASPGPSLSPAPSASPAGGTTVLPFGSMAHQSIAGLANTLAAEDAVVIKTDDWSYPRSRHDAVKIDPLDGLPFARNVSEEIGTAISTDILLRNPHRVKLLQYVTFGFPVLERSIIGVGFHYWKVFKV